MDGYTLRLELRDTDAEALLILAEQAGGRLALTAGCNAVGDRETAQLGFTRLRGLMLANPVRHAGDLVLNGRGKAIAIAIRESRIAGEDRLLRVEMQLLTWLDTSPSMPVNLMQIMESDWGIVDEIPITDGEVIGAAEELVASGLITTQATLQSLTLRPKLLPEGKKALRYGSLHRYRQLHTGSATFTDNSVHVDARESTGSFNILGGGENHATLK